MAFILNGGRRAWIPFRRFVLEMTQRNLQIGVRALRLLWRYRLRSALLMLSAALGVGGVVCSVNYGAGGSKQILDQIRRMGTNVLIITPAESRAIAGRARTGGAVTTLVERDYSSIRKELLTRTRSSAVVTGSFRAKAGDLSKTATVLGCEPDYFTIKDWPMLNGRSVPGKESRTTSHSGNSRGFRPFAKRDTITVSFRKAA